MAVGITLDDYRAQVKEVARPNRFFLSIPGKPKGINPFNFSEEMQYHVKSAALPGRTLGDITNLYWQGMNNKIAGDPTFDDMPIIFINNVNFNLKLLMEQWMSGIVDPITNTRLSHDDYKGIIRLDQLGKGAGNIIATYFLHGCYPKSLEPVELNQETIDQIEEFTVTFSLDYWSSSDTPGAGQGNVLRGDIA